MKRILKGKLGLLGDKQAVRGAEDEDLQKLAEERMHYVEKAQVVQVLVNIVEQRARAEKLMFGTRNSEGQKIDDFLDKKIENTVEHDLENIIDEYYNEEDVFGYNGMGIDNDNGFSETVDNKEEKAEEVEEQTLDNGDITIGGGIEEREEPYNDWEMMEPYWKKY